nr:MAG TPA_asm: hypothetical protein [Caudoviricetes sp.]
MRSRETDHSVLPEAGTYSIFILVAVRETGLPNEIGCGAYEVNCIFAKSSLYGSWR